MFSVSAWVFPGVSIMYVEKTKEVEVCWGFLSSCKPCRWGAKRGGGKGGGGPESLLYCCCCCCCDCLGDYFGGYVWKGISFLLFLFYDMKTASYKGDLLKWPDYYYLSPASEGLVYTYSNHGKRLDVPVSTRAATGGVYNHQTSQQGLTLLSN